MRRWIESFGRIEMVFVVKNLKLESEKFIFFFFFIYLPMGRWLTILGFLYSTVEE
jgi:hypothetical protein